MTPRFYVAKILPVGLFMALTLHFGNLVYLYLTVSALSVPGSECAPVRAAGVCVAAGGHAGAADGRMSGQRRGSVAVPAAVAAAPALRSALAVDAPITACTAWLTGICCGGPLQVSFIQMLKVRAVQMNQ